MDENFNLIDLKKLLKDSRLLNPYKESLDGYIGDFFWKAFELWEENPEEAYKNAAEYVEHVPDSILLEFMELIDRLRGLSGEEIISCVGDIEDKATHEFDLYLLKIPKSVGYFHQMDLDECIKECKDLIDYFKFRDGLDMLIGTCELIRLRYSRAIPHFILSIKSGDYVNEAKANLAYCYLHTRKTRKAQKLFLEVIQKFPENYKIRYNLALCYARRRKYKKALEYLNEAEKLEKNFFGIYKTRGSIHLKLKNNELAYKDFQRATELEGRE